MIEFKIKFNKIYSINEIINYHFGKRIKIKKEIELQLLQILQKIKKIDPPVEILINVNNRLDLDNNFYIIKLVIDFLKIKLNFDDNNKNIVSITINRDDTLLKNEYLFKVKKVYQNQN